ncbi:hypothetical protein EHQ16_00230 [Leptospira kanakyensis]|uniref:Uncharacterized protein n=1 Tax=Leptospira kanakyensis TaxID=2484968 RepID=A0A6N4PRW5_9LEPT|nr:hypothetical protein [Leptospira kanakyensis]TGK46080.1 hypothetical protein EHQ11_19220 [Leptospira kanakyensis]TGK65017.1 hypothetical protein EHQ16_00230 [Leptospira kanakyensis]TGK65449.1 hypothetical protein EHQ18_19440 [Leptospira kanakyensis]
MVFVNLSIRDLFFSDWKTPVLSTSELELEKTKESQKKGLSLLESRLESIELLMASDKWEDAKLLFRYITYDLVNFERVRSNQKEIPFGENLSHFSIPESEKKFKPFRFLESFGKLAELSGKELDEYFSSALDTYEFLLEDSKKDFKTRYATPLDRFQRIKQIRIIFLSVIFSLSLFGFLYYQYKYPVLKDQSIKIFTFVNKDKPETSEARMVSLPVLKKDMGNWVEFQFELTEAMSNFGGLRIDPLEQRGIHFVLDQIRIFDSKGKEIYFKKIVVSPNLLPEDYQDFLKIIDIKTAGKQTPGEIVEMITTGSDPQIQLVFPTLNDAKKIQFKMKYIEAHKVKKK